MTVPEPLRAFKCPLCDFEIRARDPEELVSMVQSHGAKFHEFKLTTEEVLKMSKVVAE